MSVKHSINILLFIENNFGKSESDYVFGKQLSEHLYPKWTLSDHNVLKFYTRLDKTNQEKLLNWGESRFLYFKEKYDANPSLPRPS